MKRKPYIIIAASVILASCGGGKTEKQTTQKTDTTKKKTVPVSVTEVQPQDFIAYVEVQSQIASDENVNATPQAPGVIRSINVHVGQRVGVGQVLATLDAAAIEQQIKAQDVQLNLFKQLYDKQQALWAQQIGTEVQLMQAKAQYEGALKGRDALIAQRNMYRITSPISGTVDQVNIKLGDVASPGMNGIRVVDINKMKAEANLGENYLGKVHAGDRVTLVLPDINDSIQTTLTYVAQAVDPVSRAFLVQVKLGNNKKLHPNMSCKMKIANYENKSALVVPVQVIQKTGQGDMVYVADGNTAKSVMVTTGRNSNGMVEILSGLSAGDKVVTQGYAELDNGQQIVIQ
ncbi:MAG: efflux RND transporter periplasmic adaptor subunit [Bacteroidetes bacterium]|nr:efflux RND transporter periplasmic adaptor subunit [Bacteroidota bacterium]